MHALLRYTLDLFEAPASVDTGSIAIKSVAISEPPHDGRPAQSLRQVMAPAAFTHPRANREVVLGGAVVAYSFERARRRTIGFVVSEDGLAVRAPRWTPLFEVHAALTEKADWILRKLGESRERQARYDDTRIVWEDGATFPYLGETLRLQLVPSLGGEPRVLVGGVLELGLPSHAQPEQIRDAVQAWLMRQAFENFRQRLDHFAPQLQVQWRKLRLSNAARRWGSARIDGSIRLNWRLIHYRQAVIDYVVVHELSHLRVMDHSRAFWDTVRTVVPDYAVLRAQLKEDVAPRW